jgi:MFS family permease
MAVKVVAVFGLLLTMVVLYSFAFFQRIGIPGTIFNELQTEFSMSAADVTRTGAIYLLIYAVMQPFAGIFADRFGGVRVTIISGVILTAGALLFPLSHSEYGLYWSRALVGLGSSAMYLCLVKETDRYFKGHVFTICLGIFTACGYVGGLFGTRPFRTIVESLGWRNSCLIIGVFTGISVFVLCFFARNQSNSDTKQTNRHLIAGMSKFIRNSLNYPIIIPCAICFSVYFSLQATIGPKFLEDFCKISALSASMLTFVMMCCMITSLLSAGIICKLLGNRRKAFLLANCFGTTIAIVMILIGIVFKAQPNWFLASFILLATISGCSPVVVSMIKETNDPDNVGLSVGILNTSAYLAVAVFSQFIGRTLDLFSDKAVTLNSAIVYPASAYLTVFSILLLLALLGTATAAFSRETYGKNIALNF